MHIQKGSPPTLPLSFGPWELSPVLLPISSDLSQGCSSDIFPPFVMLPSRTSSSGLMSPPLILMTLAASIAGSCWMISSHCPGLLVEGTSVFSCELPLVLWKALTDTVKCSDQMSSHHFDYFYAAELLASASQSQKFSFGDSLRPLGLLCQQAESWKFRSGGEAP